MRFCVDRRLGVQGQEIKVAEKWVYTQIEGAWVGARVVPYRGLKGCTKRRTAAEFAALGDADWRARRARRDAAIDAISAAKAALHAAGLREQALQLDYPEWVEPSYTIRPRQAGGNYTIDPFVGWELVAA